MSNLLTIKLDGVDKTSYALMDSFKLNLKTNDFNTLSIKFKDIHIEPATPGTVVLIKVISNATGATLFDGHVHDAGLEFYKLDGDITTCQCVDAVAAGQLYGNTTTGDYTAGDHTEKQILTEFFDAQGWVPNPVGAHVITGVLPSIKFNMSSMKRAIDDLAAVNSRLWYWDGDRELHYFASTGEVAPFNFSDTPNNTTTFLYGKLKPKLSKDGVWNTSGGSLICWQDGLRAGMAITITNAHLGWVARSFIINEVEMRYAGGNILNVDKFEYTINFGDVRKPRVTDYIVRSSQNVSTVDRGLVPPLENDTTKFLRSDGVYAAATGTVPKLDDCLAPDDNTDLNASTAKHGLMMKFPGGTTFLRADGTWVAGAIASHDLDGAFHSAPTDITTFNATTLAHGLLPKLGGGTTNFLRADGAWAAPPSGNVATDQIWDSKGDLAVGSGSNTAICFSLVGIPNGYVLTCNSAMAYGLHWAALPASHTQNTDWILKASNGGATFIDSGGVFKGGIEFGSSGGNLPNNTIQYDRTSGIGFYSYYSGAGHARLWLATDDSIWLSNQGVANAYLAIYSDADQYIYSLNGTIKLYSNFGVVLPNISAAPTTNLLEGLLYHNSTSHKSYYYNGSAWVELGAAGGMSSHALDGSTYHSAPTDITTYNASTAAHGFLKKLDNNAANFMNGQGNWAVPAGGTPASSVQDERSYGQVPIVGVSANYARQDHTHGSPAVVGTSMSTFTTAQRPSGAVQTNGGNIRVVIFYLRITNMTQVFQAYVNGTLAAQARVTSGSDGAGFTFVVGKNQQYYVVYGGGTQANWQWTELDITNI